MPNTRTADLYKDGEIEEHTRQLALIINEILAGKTNNLILITLAPDSELTVIERERINVDTVVSLTPRTASAASAVGLYVETSFGRIELHHDSTADADREFAAVLVG